MHRLVYAVTFRVEGIQESKASFAQKLAAWGREKGFTTHWLETPEGVVPVDLEQRPLIIYKGTFDQPELGVTFLPPIETVRVSYFVSPDLSPSEAHEIGVLVAREISKSSGQRLLAFRWDLYGKSTASGLPYILLESGMFEPEDQVPVCAPHYAPEKKETWN